MLQPVVARALRPEATPFLNEQTAQVGSGLLRADEYVDPRNDRLKLASVKREPTRMIISVSGSITHKGKNFVVVESAGLGYQVFVNTATLSKLATGSTVRLWTYEHVREDMRDLYGFMSESEHRLFLALTGISGVGPKMGLGILTLGAAEDIERMIDRGDVDALSGVSGVGKKTAQKIILELKGKLVDVSGDAAAEHDDVLVALVNLGYSREQAREALARKAVVAAGTTEDRLRLALRELGR
jgi:holliday junction DNA helicase RuvA